MEQEVTKKTHLQIVVNKSMKNVRTSSFRTKIPIIDECCHLYSIIHLLSFCSRTACHVNYLLSAKRDVDLVSIQICRHEGCSVTWMHLASISTL